MNDNLVKILLVINLILTAFILGILMSSKATVGISGADASFIAVPTTRLVGVEYDNGGLVGVEYDDGGFTHTHQTDTGDLTDTGN